MTSSNGNFFRVTGPLWGEFTRRRWIPLTKTSDTELWCFLWSALGQTFDQTLETYYDVTVMFSTHWMTLVLDNCRCNITARKPRPLFTKRTDVLRQDLMKSPSREIGCYNDRIALKFDMHLGSAAAEVPVKLHSDWKSLIPNLAASRLHEVLREDVHPLSE